MWPLEAIAQLAKNQPFAEIRDTAEDVVRVVAGRQLAAALDKAAAELLAAQAASDKAAAEQALRAAEQKEAALEQAAAQEEPVLVTLQLQAPAMAEETLLRAARMHEKATDWHTRRPSGA